MCEQATKSNHSPAYYSYLLRIWQDDEQGNTWRVSLQNVQTGKLRGFANLNNLIQFLINEFEASSRSRSNPESGEEVTL